MSENRPHIFTSPAFLACLGLLLANDFVLKPHFHNALTGKLSDFAGLFVFPLFWAALCPRLRAQIYALTALAFALWKSPLAQPLVEAWNALPLFNVARTVDPSDLLALLVLPCSYFYGLRRAPSLVPRRAAVNAVALLALFAFTATSFSKKTSYDDDYRLRYSGTELFERMRRLSGDAVSSSSPNAAPGLFNVSFDSCEDRATIAVREEHGGTVVTLKEVHYRCPGGGSKDEMRGFFEREFINRLREEPVGRSPVVRFIQRSEPPARAPDAAATAAPSTQ